MRRDETKERGNTGPKIITVASREPTLPLGVLGAKAADPIVATPEQPWSLVLEFRDGRLQATDFRNHRAGRRVRAHVDRHPCFGRLFWRSQLMSFAVFMLEQAAWATAGPERARNEVACALAAGYEAPEAAPIFKGAKGSAPWTLHEVLRAKRSRSIRAIFAADELFLDDAFGRDSRTRAVWLNVRYLPPTAIRIVIDGTEGGDAAALLRLARDIERRGGWEPRELRSSASPFWTHV